MNHKRYRPRPKSWLFKTLILVLCVYNTNTYSQDASSGDSNQNQSEPPHLKILNKTQLGAKELLAATSCDIPSIVDNVFAIVTDSVNPDKNPKVDTGAVPILMGASGKIYKQMPPDILFRITGIAGCYVIGDLGDHAIRLLNLSDMTKGALKWNMITDIVNKQSLEKELKNMKKPNINYNGQIESVAFDGTLLLRLREFAWLAVPKENQKRTLNRITFNIDEVVHKEFSFSKLSANGNLIVASLRDNVEIVNVTHSPIVLHNIESEKTILYFKKGYTGILGREIRSSIEPNGNSHFYFNRILDHENKKGFVMPTWRIDHNLKIKKLADKTISLWRSFPYVRGSTNVLNPNKCGLLTVPTVDSNWSVEERHSISEQVTLQFWDSVVAGTKRLTMPRGTVHAECEIQEDGELVFYVWSTDSLQQNLVFQSGQVKVETL